MIYLMLGFMAMGLTVAMFATKKMELGFPCLIFWAILGGYAYTQSTIPWGDWQYYLFFASAFGMTIFSAIAMYGLRDKKKTLGESEESEKYIDEGGESKAEDKATETDYDKEFEMDSGLKPSSRVNALHKRAERRRTGEVRGRRM